MKINLGKRIKSVFPVSLLLSFTFFIFGVLEMYITNIDQFEFSVWDLLITMAPMFAVCLVALMLVGILMKGKVRRYYIAVLFGLGLALYVQGNFLNNDFGILDGKTIDWSLFKVEQIISTAVWVLLPAAAVVLAKLKPKVLKKTVLFVSLGIVATQTITLAVSAIPVMGLEKGKSDSAEMVLSTDGQFELSKNKNVIVFVVDTLDTKYMQDLLNEEPEYADQLNGFTFYDNVISGYGNTQPSVPFILTGQKYLNEQPFNEYLKVAFSDSELLKNLSQNNYDIGVYTLRSYAPQSEYFDNLTVASKKATPQWSFTRNYAELIAFRYFPQLLKPYFVVYSGDINASISTDNAYKMDDPGFYNQLVTETIHAEAVTPVFRFYHLTGTHAPYTMDENAVYQKEGTSLKQQLRGSMKIILEYFTQMKTLGIYDDATIVVMSDHGYENHRNHAAFMVKQPKETDPLKTCSTPLSYLGELPATLLKLIDDTQSSDGTFFDTTLTEDRGRYFYNAVEGRKMNIGYYYDLCEYAVYGHVSDESAYVPTGLIYSPTGKSNNIFAYRLGDALTAADCLKAMAHGYHGTSNNTVFSRGATSSLLLQLDRIPEKNVKVTLNVVSTKLWPNEVSLYVNQKLVSTESLTANRGELTFVIPGELVESTELYLLFEYHGAEFITENYQVDAITDIYSFELESVVLEETDEQATAHTSQVTHALQLKPETLKNSELTDAGMVVHPDGMMHGYYMRMPAGEYYLTVTGSNLDQMMLSVQGTAKSGAGATIVSEAIILGEERCVYQIKLGDLTENTNFVIFNSSTEDFVVEDIVLRDYYEESDPIDPKN